MATKVLLVDHDSAFARDLTRELTRCGCEVAVCSDGDFAIASAIKRRPDLIVLSVEIPGTSGYSLCNKLKKHPELRSVPLLLMSSESTEETFEQHKKLRTHADDYVRKPVEAAKLLGRISKLALDPRIAEASSSSSAYRASVAMPELDVPDSTPASIERALACAIDRASAAGRWDVVTQLARELEARRKA